MNAEMQSMKDNQVWILVNLPPNCKIVGSKWLFKKKTDMDGNIHTYKAHLVEKSFTQTYGVDYEETFLLVADIKAIRILIAIAAYYDYCAVDWKSSKQSTTAMSSMEAEYILAAKTAMEAIWIRKFIYGLGVVPSINRPMDMYCDNTSAITIADEPGVQRGAKHFRQKYHFIREAIQGGDIRILKVYTDDNLVDPFTKPMPCTKHVDHARSIGLRPASSFM
ncbi:putative retrotransposon ty1-copia subclass protein [Tanacetum coccineum]